MPTTNRVSNSAFSTHRIPSHKNLFICRSLNTRPNAIHFPVSKKKMMNEVYLIAYYSFSIKGWISVWFHSFSSGMRLLSFFCLLKKKKLIRDRVLEKDNGVYQHSFWIDNTAPLCWESQWDPLLTKKSDKGKNPHQRFGFYALKYMTAIELISYPDSTNLYVTIDSKIKKRTLVTNIYTTFLDTRLLDGSTCRYMMMALWDWQPTNPPIQKSKCFFD